MKALYAIQSVLLACAPGALSLQNTTMHTTPKVPPTKTTSTQANNPIGWLNAHLVVPAQHMISSEIAQINAQLNRLLPKGTKDTPLPTPTAMDSDMDMSMDSTAGMTMPSFKLPSALQSVASQLSAAASILQTNSIFNEALLPITNPGEALSNLQDAASHLQANINSQFSVATHDIMSLYSVLESNLNHGYSVASQDVLAFATQASDSLNSASSAISLLLTNIYGFSQQTVDVLLSSPPLTALPLINPALLVLVLVAGADPVKMVENYPAWESQLASRRSAFEGNIGSVYTFISTGLPRAESLVLAGLSQLATIGNAVVNKRVAQNTENGGYQHDFNYVRTSVEPRYIDYAAPSMAAPTSTMLF